jgi:hypothetical protein
MGASVEQGIMDDEAAAGNAQTQLEAVVTLVFSGTVSVVGFSGKAAVTRTAGM